MRLLSILTIWFFVFISGLAGCSAGDVSTKLDAGSGNSTLSGATTPPFSTNTSEIPSGNYRSEDTNVTVGLPAGWAVAEGHFLLTKSLGGLTAFNSWGQPDFWALQMQSGNSFSYNLETIAAQVPSGGAYVVIVRIWGPPAVPPYDTPEYIPNDLTELWTAHDARQDGGESFLFYKWGKYFQLDVYCSPNASEETSAALNSLLGSWRFDQVPEGDPEWAQIQARQLLPEVVKPLWFPMRSGSANSDKVNRTTEIEVRGDTFHIRFIYSWGGVRPPNPIPAGYSFSSSHYWEIDVLPTGDAVLLAEGGVALP